MVNALLTQIFFEPLDVPLGSDIGPCLSDISIGSNQNRRANKAPICAPVILLFSPYAIGLDCLVVRIGEKDGREAVFGAKCRQALRTVRADADDDDAAFGEPIGIGRERQTLIGAGRSVSLGIEI